MIKAIKYKGGGGYGLLSLGFKRNLFILFSIIAKRIAETLIEVQEPRIEYTNGQVN